MKISTILMTFVITVLVYFILTLTIWKESLVEITQYVPIGTYRDKLNNDITKYCAIMNDLSVRCIDVPVVR